MNKIATFPGGVVLLILAVALSLQMMHAQDDPRQDNTVGILPPEAFGPNPNPPAPLVVITSADGYDNFNLGVDFAEPHMSTNPLDPLQFFNAYNTNGTHHTQNGYDWTTNNPAFPSAAGDPVTGYDNLGNLFYMTMKLPVTGTWVVKSTNNGATWGAAISAVNGGDKCWMSVDQTDGPFSGNIYGTMTSTSFTSGNFSRSTNHGASFTQTFTTTTQTLPGMMSAVGANTTSGVSGGCVYVVANGGSTTAETFTFFRSTDGGATFSLMSTQFFAGYIGNFVAGRHSVQNSRTRPYPFIAADNSFGPHRGRLYCVFASNDPPGDGNKPDIWIRHSDDQGVTWTGALRINDDASPTLHHQWTPAIWCDVTTGRLYAKWYDTRLVPTSDSTDVYASYSDDGGDTWAANQRLTTAHFKINCTTCGGGGVPAYQGDYDAITSNEQGAMAVWTDFRAGNFGSYTAYFPDYAMMVSPTTATKGLTDDIDITLDVPTVKLYAESVTFSAEVTPSGPFTVSFPSGNTLATVPGTLPLNVSWTGATAGDYTITVTGVGPNGTPVHKRTVALTLTDMGGGVPCSAISSIAARCIGGGTKTIQARVNLLGSTIYAGMPVTITIDGTPFTATIISNGTDSRANFSIAGWTVGSHTVSLVDPAGCGLGDKHPECLASDAIAKSDPTWDDDAAWAAHATPQSTKLVGNYPNPFNPSTSIQYELAQDNHVILKIYNTLGQEIATLVNAFQSAGRKSATWNGKNEAGTPVTSGIYIYRLTAGNIVKTEKMMLMK